MLTLRVCRRLPASRESVFDALTTPEALEKWWGPVGVRCVFAAIDLRPGGRYEIRNQLPDGSLLTISGEYTAVERPHLLAFTWTTGTESGVQELVTITLSSAGTQTAIEIRHDRISDNKIRTQHRAGWNGCLGGLNQYLVRRNNFDT